MVGRSAIYPARGYGKVHPGPRSWGCLWGCPTNRPRLPSNRPGNNAVREALQGLVPESDAKVVWSAWQVNRYRLPALAGRYAEVADTRGSDRTSGSETTPGLGGRRGHQEAKGARCSPGSYTTPWLSSHPASSGPFRGGRNKGEASFTRALIGPLHRHSPSREERLAPEASTQI